MPLSTNYSDVYEVEVARSFEEAQEMIRSAEKRGTPYADLDLPVSDEARFWQFVRWMEETDRKYGFSVFGAESDEHFWTIAQKVREKGFHFNS